LSVLEKVRVGDQEMIPGTILRNCRGEYGMVMRDGQILRMPKEEAEKLIAEMKGPKPA